MWGFGMAQEAVAAARESFPDRILEPDPRNNWAVTYRGAHLSRLEKQDLMRACYKHCALLKWRKGDILLVDNERLAHARMNGVAGDGR